MELKLFILLITISGVITQSQSEVYLNYPDVEMKYKFHRIPLTWYEAKLACANEGAELAMPRNEAEAMVIKNIFQGYPNKMLSGTPYPEYVLLGFHDMFEEGEYVSLGGKSLQYYYHTWDFAQPDNVNNEDCGSMSRYGNLNDFPCEVAAVFVCQKHGNMMKNESIDDHCAKHDPAYKHAVGVGKYYKLHMNAKKWSDARLICNLEGGHLAIIRSKEDESYLKKIFNDPNNFVNYTLYPDFALIGFHDLYKESYFTTVLDESLHDLGYLNWHPEQPDNLEGENCGAMHRSGGLNDFPCDVPSVFFCERKQNPTP